MLAIQLKEFGSADQLYITEFPTPVPTGQEIRVAVHATALNRADIMQREGHYPPPEGESPILGLEMAGVVESVGADVTRWKPGDRVFGLLPGGGYAEFAVMHQDMAMPIPPDWTFVETAAVPEVFLTAFQALQWVGKLKAGETVLLHAGASGVGTAAIQVARLMGATILVTASAGKHELCLRLGAKHAIDYRKGPFLPELLDQTEGKGVHLIIDPIGGDYFDQNIQALQRDGRLVMLAVMGGGKTSANIGPIVFKRLQILGTTLRSRTRAYQIALTQEFMAFGYDHLVSKALTPIVDQVFDWHNVAEAHRYMEANLSAGKVILQIKD
ncbi:NAD(P)H-quinone oxidoreductase [Arundinibacter roseus]|uniref:NAD(P)H-quinone oxidoreductase n=1 Tax=Arundinibacter roseus TaxID=2070510 RepID=A0A4R4K7N0_9BACT|nr:NAD(P)H-quinone oxidoreductase [Arundinibacter roseus]TDB63363.1 NAD(P)H-quinone oxidoreductase [Arundinibacter roseus]